MIIQRQNHDRAPASIGRSELDAALPTGPGAHFGLDAGASEE